MSALNTIFPPFGLRISCGSLVISPITVDDILPLVEVASAGVAKDGRPNPFRYNWTAKPLDELGTSMAQFYWSTWGTFAKENWSLLFAVRFEGQVVGCQDLMARNFALTRTAETGSWLGDVHQGKGIGTLMRQVACAFAFDELGAVEVRSAAWVDNPSSRRVSEKVGYKAFDEVLLNRDGEAVAEVQFKLAPGDLVRPPHRVEVEGITEFKKFIGI